jgi:hypothetical protein
MLLLSRVPLFLEWKSNIQDIQEPDQVIILKKSVADQFAGVKKRIVDWKTKAGRLRGRQVMGNFF